jgi:predicted porin
MTAKERQRKAYLERKAKESGAKQPETASQAISQTKSAAATPAAEKKPKPAPSGKTRAERDKERNAALRAKYNAEKQKALAGYKEVHGKLPTGKERTKLLAAVQKAHPPHPSGTLK